LDGGSAEGVLKTFGMKQASPKPLVSIVTPAYNGENYLDETIRSVVAQTYPNWELIIVDDGSKDRTAEIVKAWAAKDARIQYVYQENQRMASARNNGIKHAKGKYVAFLDHDNIFLPKKLELQVAHLEAHPEIGVSYAKIFHFYHPDTKTLYENRNEKPLAEDQFRDLLHRNAINVLSVLVRKEYFDKYGAFQQGWKACDEHYVWINLAEHDVRFGFLPETVGLLRLHKKNDSARPGHIYDTAFYFLQLLDIVENRLPADKKEKYAGDIAALHKEWRWKLIAGKLMKNPLTSWFFLRLYLSHRGENFTKVS
jgi:glycosyltransferase involved in cell wall biosynthesis